MEESNYFKCSSGKIVSIEDPIKTVVTLNPQELIELADYMIARWQDLKEDAKLIQKLRVPN